MSYAVKSIFKTIQGEGANAGRVAVFVRFAGCNGWSGREEDRMKGTLGCAAWCDTDFVGIDGEGGGRYESVALARKCSEVWGADRTKRFVVLTGGEPTLQVDANLIDVLHRWEFEVAIETNGTHRCPAEIDWITVSPKLGLPLVQTAGNELKLVYPQFDMKPEQFIGMDFNRFILQPKWVDDKDERHAITQETIDYCLSHPRWEFGLQAHKVLNLP